MRSAVPHAMMENEHFRYGSLLFRSHVLPLWCPLFDSLRIIALKRWIREELEFHSETVVPSDSTAPHTIVGDDGQ